MCATCSRKSTATLKFWEFPESGLHARPILVFNDILGNSVEINTDGSSNFHVVLDPWEPYETDDDDDDYNPNTKRRSSILEKMSHKQYCETLKLPTRNQYRIFAMNRDLTAREYLHRSVRQEMAAVFGDEMSMIQYPISRRPELCRLITFVPVEPELRSKELSCQYRVRYS